MKGDEEISVKSAFDKRIISICTFSNIERQRGPANACPSMVGSYQTDQARGRRMKLANRLCVVSQYPSSACLIKGQAFYQTTFM
jgi:hypothetical protein